MDGKRNKIKNGSGRNISNVSGDVRFNNEIMNYRKMGVGGKESKGIYDRVNNNGKDNDRSVMRDRNVNVISVIWRKNYKDVNNNRSVGRKEKSIWENEVINI